MEAIYEFKHAIECSIAPTGPPYAAQLGVFARNEIIRPVESLSVYLELLSHASAGGVCTYLSDLEMVIADAKRKGVEVDKIEKRIDAIREVLTKVRRSCPR